MTATRRHFSFLNHLCLALLLVLIPASANPGHGSLIALVPLDLGPDKTAPLGSPANPCPLIELIRNPDLITPGLNVSLPKPSGQDLMVLPTAEKNQFSGADKWKYTKDLMNLAGWKLPTEIQAQKVKVKSIKVTGTASTYGRNDGFAGQRTSSGRVVTSSTAALQMDLAHVLSDLGAVPFSMRDVKATLTMPDGRQVPKRLEDKGGLVNYLGEGYWRKAIESMSVDADGVGTLAPLPASHYRVVDIFTQSRSTLIPQVTVEIHLKKPLVRKAKMSPSQCQKWMQSHFEAPQTESVEALPPFK